MKKINLNEEERAVLAAIEGGRWKGSGLTAAERNRYAQIAKNTKYISGRLIPVR